jgi:parvulin-like peptidyl-prolyl isomerase
VKRLPAPLAVLAVMFALSLGLSGCNVRFSPYAAVVNGTEISQTQLHAAILAIMANSSYKCAIESSGTTHFTGAGQGTYNSTFTAEVLSILIQDKVVGQYVSKLKLPEPTSLSTTALAQLEQSTAPPSTCPGSGASLMAAFNPSYRAQLVKFQVDEDALAAHALGTSLVPSHLDSYVAGHKNQMSAACVSVIEVTSNATAVSLRSQLEKGANFATLAKAHSVDTTTAPQGGALGCIADSLFTAPLDTDLARLAIGQVSSPIAFSTDYLLLEVTARQPETSQELVSSVVSLAQPALNKTFPTVVKAAKVQLDPQFGTWDTKGTIARVVANPGPPAAIVPNSGANLGAIATTGTSASG